MKFWTIFLIMVCVLSCHKKEREERAYYPSGNCESIKYYYSNNLIKTVKFYDSIVPISFIETRHKKGYDSLCYYYKNGVLYSTGNKTIQGNYIGKWNFYTKEGFLSETNEYMIIKGETKLNQVWFYNQKRDTMFYGNKNFNIYDQEEFREDPNKIKRTISVDFEFISDTITIDNPFRGLVKDWHPFWRQKNSESYVVLGKEEFNFNADFSNENQVKADTFYCLEKDKLNKQNFPKSDKRYTVAFGKWFKTPGKKILRGYVEEKYTKIPIKENDISMESRRTYFEKVIYVKDTVKTKKK